MTFPGLSMGIFAGDLRFTAYRGTNLLRMDALAKTNEEWVAYKYEAGLKGFSTDADAARRLARHRRPCRSSTSSAAWSTDRWSPVRAQNRVLVAEGKGGVAGDLHAAAHLLLHARGRHQPRLRLVPQGRGETVRHRHPAGRRRRRARSTSTTSRSTTRRRAPCSGWASISTPAPTPPKPTRQAVLALHARRRVQAAARLQDVGEPLPPAVHRAACAPRARSTRRCRTWWR